MLMLTTVPQGKKLHFRGFYNMAIQPVTRNSRKGLNQACVMPGMAYSASLVVVVIVIVLLLLLLEARSFSFKPNGL